MGLDPTDSSDAYDDPDRDGERNIDEVVAHTNPMVALSPSHPVVRYLYDVAPFTKTTGEACFQIDVRHITLLTTGKGTSSRSGANRVLLYFTEAPLDRALDHGHVRIACADVRYVDGALKTPISGVVPFVEADFKEAMAFDPSKDCKVPAENRDAGTGGTGSP
jgi:hypothetical protein